MFSLVLILSFLVSLSDSYSVSEYPTWPVTCSFSRYEDKRPLAYPYTWSSTTTPDQCEGLCEGDPHCGMYEWWGGVSTSCRRYQTSVMLWEDLGLPEGDMWGSSSSYRSGSKLCKGESLPTTCTEYEYTDRKQPPYSGRITGVGAYSSLTPDHCKDLCSHYSECESVMYYRMSSDDYTTCQLYKTKLADGGVVECGSIYTECGTYERVCGVEVTTTSLPPTTTSLPPSVECPTDLDEYHGSTTCIPAGHTQEECEALTGCCYLVVGPTGWCLRPVITPK